MSLRDIKAARIKLNILEQTIDLIGNGSFKDLLVDDICLKAEISKVTLFKYFSKKEDILVYFMKIWLFKRIVELINEPKTGLEAIRYLFHVLGEEADRSPGLILGLVGYIANLTEPPEPQEIKYEERKILFPEQDDLDNIEILSIDQMFLKHLQEAADLGEIKSQYVNDSVVELLLALFYGSSLAAHTSTDQKMSDVYSANLAFVLDMLR